MQVSDEDVEDMMAVMRMAGAVMDGCSDKILRQVVRKKLEEGKTPCFESMKWVKREKQNEGR